MAVFDESGNMIAICNTPDTEKVIITNGASGEVEVTMHIEITNTGVISFIINPNVVTATKRDIEDHNTSLKAHVTQFKQKADVTDLSEHVNNTNIHVTAEKTDEWDAAYIHAHTVHVTGLRQNGTDMVPDAAGRIDLPTASTIQAGLVRLNDTLTSNSTDQALTAAQGKVLNDKITAVASSELPDGSITTDKLADGAVTADKLAGDAIPAASTSTAGKVQLNNTLTSNSTTQALTAAQGKALNDSMPKYGTCSTAAGTAAKTVSIDSFQLTADAMIAVKFTSGSTAASPTLNINGTGAKYIYQNGDIARSLTINAKQTVLFIYDGSYYRMIDIPLPNPTKVSSLVIGSSTASGSGSFAQGFSCEASNSYSHAEGTGATASGNSSHAEGTNAIASGLFSHAEGGYTTASGSYSHASGYHTTAPSYSFVIGKYNKTLTAASSESSSIGDAFAVGSGTSDSNLKNAFRIGYSGDVYTTKTYTSSGADYAEYFEWADGNPDGQDRTGLFVTLDGGNIRPATAADTYILGEVSAAPSVVGDAASEDWHGRYLTDIYGRVIKGQQHFEAVTQTIHHAAEKDSNGNIIKEAWDDIIEIEPAHDDIVWKVNPDYDPEQVYIPRGQRPEYAPVGLLGKLVVRDDGSCQADGFCYPGADGIGTAADTGYRVMARLDPTHVKIVLK